MPRIRRRFDDTTVQAALVAVSKAYLAQLNAFIRAMEFGGAPPPPPPTAPVLGQMWAEILGISPPRVTWSAPLLMQIPAMVPRAQVGESILPGWISAETIRKDEAPGKDCGPRVALEGPGRIGIVYPAPYFLEYLETRVVPKISDAA
jgi:DNA-binding transcriptional regulator YdaS (Cro superfamily)